MKLHTEMCRLVTIVLSHLLQLAGSATEFDDSVLFRLHWPGQVLDEYAALVRDGQSMIPITTADNEHFVCSIPASFDDDDGAGGDYMGPSPDQLLQPLYTQRSCTYRIEMYWTYELCHGRFIQQYHDEKDITSKTVKRQDYILGQFQPGTEAPGVKAANKAAASFDEMRPPRRKLEEAVVPYYPVVYSQGTVCDINQQPRRTTVLYVCDKNGKNQIESFSETSSCEYELLVLTPLLCAHPAFRQKEATQHKIDCFPRAGSPPQPTALTLWQREQKWDQEHQYNPLKHILNTQLDETDHQQQQPGGSNQIPKPQPPVQKERPAAPQQTPAEADEMLMASFLAGTYCLYGGAGWWKHEYCHTKQVLQYHEEPGRERTEILLGRWDHAAHLAWIADNPQKAPVVVKGRVHQVTHLYADGSHCDETGRPRRVEVRLRCRESQGSANAVTLYMLEPKTCEYILGVESSMFCQLMQTADANGLFQPS